MSEENGFINPGNPQHDKHVLGSETPKIVIVHACLDHPDTNKRMSYKDIIKSMKSEVKDVRQANQRIIKNDR